MYVINEFKQQVCVRSLPLLSLGDSSLVSYIFVSFPAASLGCCDLVWSVQWLLSCLLSLDAAAVAFPSDQLSAAKSQSYCCLCCILGYYSCCVWYLSICASYF